MAPKCVSTAFQSAGGFRSPEYKMFATRATVVKLRKPPFGWAAIKPNPASDKAKPPQDQAGKRKPAAVDGEAKPIRPRGGMTPIRRATGARQSSCRVLSVQSKAYGRASNRAQTERKSGGGG